MATEETALDAMERILGSAQRMAARHLDLLRAQHRDRVPAPAGEMVVIPSAIEATQISPLA